MTDQRWPIEEALSHSYELSNIKVHGIAARAIAALKEIEAVAAVQCAAVGGEHYITPYRQLWGKCCDDCPACIARRALRMED